VAPRDGPVAAWTRGCATRSGPRSRAAPGRGAGKTVSLGKFLSPKWLVNCGVSIAEAINTIKLRYTLNARWSVQA